jgi:hypothetical protein
MQTGKKPRKTATKKPDSQKLSGFFIFKRQSLKACM